MALYLQTRLAVLDSPIAARTHFDFIAYSTLNTLTPMFRSPTWNGWGILWNTVVSFHEDV
jgi:hypothetical protein